MGAVSCTEVSCVDQSSVSASVLQSFETSIYHVCMWSETASLRAGIPFFHSITEVTLHLLIEVLANQAHAPCQSLCLPRKYATDLQTTKNWHLKFDL